MCFYTVVIVVVANASHYVIYLEELLLFQWSVDYRSRGKLLLLVLVKVVLMIKKTKMPG